MQNHLRFNANCEAHCRRSTQVKPGEQGAIVTDWERPWTITMALASAMRYLGAEVTVVAVSPRDHGVSTTPPVAGAIWAGQVVIMQTSFAAIHTQTLASAGKGDQALRVLGHHRRYDDSQRSY
jgi:hypothetical protein